MRRCTHAYPLEFGRHYRLHLHRSGVVTSNCSTPASPFNFEGKDVRVDVEDGVEWFHAADVCDAIAYANSRLALTDHVDSDDVSKRYTIDSMNRKQLSNFINESGLYALIFGSKKPEAKRFKRWVTSRVLPEIRKTGRYEAPRQNSRSAASARDRP